MALFEWFYVLFNQGECLLWWAFGAYFVIVIFQKKHRGALLAVEIALVVGFLFFGLSDFVESNDQGAPPLGLWLWKIANGIFLFGLLIYRDYVLRGRVALNPWRFIVAGGILAVALYQLARMQS